MDKCLQQTKDVTLCLAALCFTLATSKVFGASASKGIITEAKKDVRLVGSDGVSRSVAIKHNVPAGTTLQTGMASRAEVTFDDQTVARFAANTALSLENRTRKLKLNVGAILLQVPKAARGVKVQADGVVANVTGTTVMLEHHPGMYKFFVLEGESRLYRPGHLGDSILVSPGQMVIGNPHSAISDPVDVDIGRFFQTSRFITEFPPLRSEAAIIAASQKQGRQKSKNRLLDTNLVIHGGGSQVSLLEPAEIVPADHAGGAQTTAAGTEARSPSKATGETSPTPKDRQ